MAEPGLNFYRDRFTDTQRRRAEAFILVRHLYPHIDAYAAMRVAHWMTTGRSSPPGS